MEMERKKAREKMCKRSAERIITMYDCDRMLIDIGTHKHTRAHMSIKQMKIGCVEKIALSIH